MAKWIFAMAAAILQLSVVAIVTDMSLLQTMLCALSGLTTVVITVILVSPDDSRLLSEDILLEEGIRVMDATTHLRKIEDTFPVCVYCGSNSRQGHLPGCKLAAAMDCLGERVRFLPPH